MELRGDIGKVTEPCPRRTTPNPRVRLSLCAAVFLVLLNGISALRAQDTPPNPPPPVAPEPADLPGQVVVNSAGQCVQPPPMVQMKDYNGPFSKVVGTFTQKLDRQSVHVPHYKQGLVL